MHTALLGFCYSAATGTSVVRPMRNSVFGRHVASLIGALLVSAALLKFYGVAFSPIPSIGRFDTPSVQISVSAWEIVLGFSLVSGTNRLLASGLGIGTFAAFAATSGYLGWQGVAICACFGPVPMSPWYAFAFDIVAVLGLLMTRPAGSVPIVQLSQLTLSSAIILAGAAASVALMGLVATIMAGSVETALARIRGEALSAPSYVDFGTARPGEVCDRSITIYNRTDRPIELVGGTSDCGCDTMTSLPITIPGNDFRNVTVLLTAPRLGRGQATKVAILFTDSEVQRRVRIHLGCRVE